MAGGWGVHGPVVAQGLFGWRFVAERVSGKSKIKGKTKIKGL